MIRLVDVSLRLGAFELRSINLEIERGEYFAILGPTGAGKTKLLEVIAGLQSPASGEVWINEEDVTQLPPERRRIGFMYQDYLLFPHLTARKNIEFGLKREARTERAQRVSEVAALLGIEPLLDRSTIGLSGGEQQRIALARAMAPRPLVLLLDEPLSALDPASRKMIRRELRTLHDRLGATTIHVTHDFEEALVVADRLAIMKAGEIAQVGSPQEVFQKPRSSAVADFLGVDNLLKGTVSLLNATGGSDRNAGNAIFEFNKLRFVVIADQEGPANATIRPEDIVVSREPTQSSARNQLPGLIVDITNSGPLARVTADVGTPLIALMTSQSVSALDLKIGTVVYFSIKATAIHIF